MLSGGCLCGAMRFAIDGALGPISFCHCSLCRRSSGSAFVASASVSATSFRILLGMDVLGDFESSPQNHRVFCTRCGSQLYGRHDTYPIVRVRIGALDGDPGGRCVAHIMTGSKGPWYEINDGAEQFAELPPLSYFLPGPQPNLSKTAPEPRPNVALVARLYEAFKRRDMPTIFGLLAPDVEIFQASEVPWGGTYQGHDGVMAFFAKLVQSVTSAITLERFIDAGDQVVAIGRNRGTVNANGAVLDVAVAHVWTVRDGLIARVEYYVDDPAMLAAL
jgi:ketosteroid isomerase-like protein